MTRASRPLTCCICQKFSKHPKVTSCCGSVTCSSCFDEWTSRSSACPHCGRSMRRSHQQERTTKRQKRSIGDSRQCAIHGKASDYMCLDCRVYLCGDCIFEQLNDTDSPHVGHTISKISDVKDPTDELRKELALLKESIASIDVAMAASERQALTLRGYREDVRVTIYTVFQQIKDQFDRAIDDVKQPLAGAMDTLHKQSLMIANFAEEAETILNGTDCRNAAAAQAFLENLRQQTAEITVSGVPDVGPIPENRLLPEMATETVEIPNFLEVCDVYSKMKESDTRFICSEEMKMFGGEWRVKIYPSGNGNGLGTHLSLFVELLKAPTPVATYVYKMTISGTDRRDLTREYPSPFKQMDSWGWNRAAELSVIKSGGYLVGDNNTLKIRIGLRPEGYRIIYDTCCAKYECVNEEYLSLREELDDTDEEDQDENETV